MGQERPFPLGRFAPIFRSFIRGKESFDRPLPVTLEVWTQKGNAMPLTELKHLLLISTLINYAIVTIWFLVFAYAHDALYRLHTRWFRLSPMDFDKLHYAAMAIYKIGVLLLNLAPLIAISIAGN